MNPSVLFVAYPMLPVSDASCGGAEQMLWTLEREMNRRGHRTSVAACDASQVSGELIPTGNAPGAPDAYEFRAAEHSRRVIDAVNGRKLDLVHDKSGFWWRHANQCSAPVLATLHLPRSFYSEQLFVALPTNVYFNCVSATQANDFRDLPRMTGIVPNGIVLDRFAVSRRKTDYVLWLGRICPEKGPHLAMDAAHRAGIPLVMAGRVYPFSWHQLYFEQEIRPRLQRAGSQVKWIEQPSFDEKAELLRHARAVLLPTLAPETSSLVAMEAAACGTPVIAFANGALPEIVRQSVTGFLVNDVTEMSLAIADVDRLWPDDARRHAEEEFSSGRMAERYEQLYQVVVAQHAQCSTLAA